MLNEVLQKKRKKRKKKTPALYNNKWQQKQLSVKNWLLAQRKGHLIHTSECATFRVLGVGFFSPPSRNYHNQNHMAKKRKEKIEV